MSLLNDFQKVLEKIIVPGTKAKVALAVSGGPDSMCLALLTHQCGIKLTALTVDHRLRKESRHEAQQVHHWMKKLGIEHHILTWEHEPITHGLQAKAREGRYQLLEQYCQTHGFTHLLVGHTANDQYETIVMRLAHHSGPDGLAGMPLMSMKESIYLARPLLPFKRKKILEYLAQQDCPWIQDPSNENMNFTRIQIRQNIDSLYATGLNFDRVLAFQQKMAVERVKEEDKLLSFWQKFGKFYPEGYAQIDLKALSELAPIDRQRLLSHVLRVISGKKYPPKFESLDHLLSLGFKKSTCHGCVIVAHKNFIQVCREFRHVEGPKYIEKDQPVVWDQRFKIVSNQRMEVRALGQDWHLFRGDPYIKDLPSPVRDTLPALLQKEQLIYVPFLGYYRGLEEKLDCKVTFFPIFDLGCKQYFSS